MSFLLPRHPADALVAIGEPADRDRTAADLMRDVATLAAALPPADPPGEILIICQDRYHFAASLLAAWHAGHAVALPPNGQPQTVSAISKQPGVRLLLHDTDSAEGLDLRPLLAHPVAEPAVMKPIEPEQHIATLYTSGSTGSHKACHKSAAQLLGEASMLAEAFHIGPESRVLATVPAHHIYGLLWSVLAPLCGGASFVRQTPYAEAVAARLEETRATMLVSVPAHLRSLEALTKLPPLKRIVSSGGMLPTETANMVKQRFGMPITNIFGSSETGGIAWRTSPDAPLEPMPGIKVSAGEEGRLMLDSPFLTAEAGLPVACDDRIEMVDERRFRLQGRLDGVVKVGGKRIALAEIEQRMLSIPGVKDAAALAVETSGARGTEIWAAAVAPGKNASEIKAALRQWLDPVTLPRRMRLVERLPREENGKLTRSKLQALFDEKPNEPVTELLPRSEKRLEGANAETYELEIEIPANLLYFHGHFDGHPILPGVVQLNGLVLTQIHRIWPELGFPRRVMRLKFKHVILPGALLRLKLERQPGQPRVAFEIARENEVCACGTLVFE
jgi:4-coumarate--CoA ligase (photoactive yellow protein activation family)